LASIKKGFVGVTEEDVMVPVLDFAAAHFAKSRHQNASALQQFVALERLYPNNVYLLLNIGTIQVRIQS